jgi:hypothetical protein
MNNNRGLGTTVMALAYVDAFGAPEYLVDDIAFRSMVGGDYVRMGFYTQEPGEKILRVKIVFPVCRLYEAQTGTQRFVTDQRSKNGRLELVVR